MGIREEVSQKTTKKATDLQRGDTFRTLKEREPFIISEWDDDEEEGQTPIAISLLTGESACLDHFGIIIPTNFVITEE